MFFAAYRLSMVLNLAQRGPKKSFEISLEFHIPKHVTEIFLCLFGGKHLNVVRLRMLLLTFTAMLLLDGAIDLKFLRIL